MATRRPTVLVGLLGTTLDKGSNDKRWNRWRPTVSACAQPDLLVHRLLTICLKHKEETRALIEQIDYAQYAEMCSEKSLNARKAGKDCQRLFHCLLLKAEGPRVYDALVFDVDG